MKNLIKLTLMTFAITSFIACSSDDGINTNGNFNIKAKSGYSVTKLKSNNVDISVSSFLINLSEFELELDLDDLEDSFEANNEQWDDDGYFDFEDEIELEGPFEMDLLAGEISFINVEVPVGKYEEIEFEFDVSTDVNSELFGKSILIKGTIDGTPFQFWHDFEDEIEADFEDPQFDVTISPMVDEGIVINFNLDEVLDATTGVNLGNAADGNNDGLIEISPTDTDGNNEIADAIRNAIKNQIDLLDD